MASLTQFSSAEQSHVHTGMMVRTVLPNPGTERVTLQDGWTEKERERVSAWEVMKHVACLFAVHVARLHLPYAGSTVPVTLHVSQVR